MKYIYYIAILLFIMACNVFGASNHFSLVADSACQKEMNEIEALEKSADSCETATLFDMLVAMLLILFVGYLVLRLRTHLLYVFHKESEP